MSGSSLASSRHRKPSLPPRRICDYGDNHVHRDEYEKKKDHIRALEHEIEKKNQELLVYHNDLAAEQTKVEELKEQAEKLAERIPPTPGVRTQEYDTLVDEYNKLQDEFNELREERNTVSTQAKEALENLKKELREANEQGTKRARELSTLETENKKLKTESRALREKKEQAELDLRTLRVDSAFTPPPDNLEPLRNLHPALSKTAAGNIAKELVDIISFELNDIWAQLPRQEEPALITPSTQRLDLVLNRLKKAITEDANLRLAPKLQQCETEKLILEGRLHGLESAVSEWEQAARFCANTAAQRGDQPVPTPENLRNIVNGLKDQEEHADSLAIENQAIIFAWENASLLFLPQKDDIPLTPEDFLKNASRERQTLRDHLGSLRQAILQSWKDLQA